MAIGDMTLTHHGVHNISGAALATAVGNINLSNEEFQSGARVFIVPAGQGQVAVLEVAPALAP